MARVGAWCIMFMCVAACFGNKGIYVFVNHMLLEDSMDWSTSKQHRVHYWFAPDDEVDIWCMCWWNKYARFSVDYQFGDETLGGNDTYTSSRGNRILGLRTRLRAAHHGGSVTCRGEQRESTEYITVQLLMRDSFDGILDVKTNNVSIRYQLNPELAADSYLVKYLYITNKSVTLECNTSLDDGVVQVFTRDSLPQETKVIGLWEVLGSPLTNVALNNATVLHNATSNFNVLNKTLLPEPKVAGLWRPLGSPLTCVAGNNATVLRNVTLRFLMLNKVFPPPPLSINLTGILELYDVIGDRYVHYHYDEGETLTLNCSSSVQRVKGNDYTLIFGDTVESSKDYIVQEIKLTSEYHERIVDCRLMDKEYLERTHIQLTFRLRTRVAGSSGASVPVSIGIDVGVMVGIGANMACVALALGVFVTWRCRRTLARRREVRSAAAIEMARIQTRRLPHAPLIETYDYVYNDGIYEEIPEVTVRASSPEYEKLLAAGNVVRGQDAAGDLVRGQDAAGDLVRGQDAVGDLVRGQRVTGEEEPVDEQTQQGDKPGVQNTMYYWLSSSSSSSSVGGDENG